MCEFSCFLTSSKRSLPPRINLEKNSDLTIKRILHQKVRVYWSQVVPRCFVIYKADKINLIKIKISVDIYK